MKEIWEAALWQAFGDFLFTCADGNNRSPGRGARRAGCGPIEMGEVPQVGLPLSVHSQGRTDTPTKVGAARKNLLSTCCMPDPVLGLEERNEQDTGPMLQKSHLRTHSLIHPSVQFNRHLLSTYCVPSPILGSGETNKTCPYPQEVSLFIHSLTYSLNSTLNEHLLYTRLCAENWRDRDEQGKVPDNGKFHLAILFIPSFFHSAP